MSLVGSLGALVCRNADGSVDFEGTADAVSAALAAEVEATAVRDSEIEATLDDVFARLNTDIYPTPEVVSIAAATLVGSDITKMASTAEEVRDFLSRTARFVGERGRKGGLRRLSK